MAFVARKPFTYRGHHYRPGEIVKGFPKDFLRPETFIRTGIIVETEAKKRGPKPKKAEPVVEAVEEIIEEPAVEVDEEPAEVLEVVEEPEPEPTEPVEE